MCASGRPITRLLFCLFISATSSPVSISTPAPPLPLQISPPSPSARILPSPPSSPLSVSEVGCPLTLTPSSLVVRFGDPVTANCSLSTAGFSGLGWVVSLAAPEFTMDCFLVWSVERMTEWSMEPVCYAMAEQGGQCKRNLSLTVYKPPDNVSISFVNHTRPMSEGQQFTLQCEVQDVAPVNNLRVTFYKGQTVLGHTQSSINTDKKPVSEVFTLNMISTKEDDGVEFWCEAKLELGAEGPQPPPVVESEKLTAAVLFGPQLMCPTKLRVREGESLSCEARGNPPPSVTWFRDGQVVALPTNSSREHAGEYTVSAKSILGETLFTVDVEVLPGKGTTNSYNGHFLLAVLLIWTINWS
ncbi:hemicentin-2-like [Trematomus bernacchii]|uniref:hemicentin-2-like n=1 Tax=Trematomus bernacchii TaxID=40690 RepID=UPI00146E8BC7|nr:hemicentin-2-like [Trematomus bernacchii]